MPRSLAMEILSAIASASRTRRSGDDGPDLERDFPVGEFDRLEIAAPFDVDIETGGAANVHASGPEWALDSVRVELQGERLFIGCDGDCDGSDISMSVSVPALRGLRMAGSGDVSVDKLTGDAFDSASSGSGDLSIESIDVRSLKHSSAGSGDVSIDWIRSDQVEVAIMGSGDLSVDAVDSAEFRLTMNGSGDSRIGE